MSSCRGICKLIYKGRFGSVHDKYIHGVLCRQCEIKLFDVDDPRCQCCNGRFRLKKLWRYERQHISSITHSMV